MKFYETKTAKLLIVAVAIGMAILMVAPTNAQFSGGPYGLVNMVQYQTAIINSAGNQRDVKNSEDIKVGEVYKVYDHEEKVLCYIFYSTYREKTSGMSCFPDVSEN